MLLIKLSSPKCKKEIILLPIRVTYLFNAALVVGGELLWEIEKW